MSDGTGWILPWITDQALPLWTGPGWHPQGAGVWEELDSAGHPIPGPRRFRVQLRQVWALATLGRRLGRADLVAQAGDLLDFALRAGFDAEGRMAATLDADGAILSAPHDLYDIAFLHLAVAALIRAGQDGKAALGTAEAALARLDTPRGWAEAIPARLPRRQNPHMHLFESALALFEATGDAPHRARAETCLALLHEVFLRPDGVLLEYFTETWQPLAEGQQIEPGHMAEWIWLLDRFEALTGADCGVDLARLWDQVLARRDASGLLPDTDTSRDGPRRLWPQTEFLRASLVMQARGLILAPGVRPSALLARLRTEYLSAPCPGGWIDRADLSGQPLEFTGMPASSFYHILGALLACLDAATEV
jgi:mannose/cellobiose epimerase-like protein (N-acyl-D-glucosamine 2-epimerase family)